MILVVKHYNGDTKKDVIFIKMLVSVPLKVMKNFVNMKTRQNVQVVERVKVVVLKLI